MGDAASGGLSTSAWAAIAAIGAAVITGGVTLLTHFLPPAEPGASSVASMSSPAPVTRPAGLVGTATTSPGASGVVSGIPSEAVRQFVGTWSGPATDGRVSGTLTLTVTPSCAVGSPCGTMTSSLYGCQWDIDLVTIRDGPQLRVVTVRLGSGDPGACALHPVGDDFQIGRGQLIYTTGYSGSTNGLLTRVG